MIVFNWMERLRDKTILSKIERGQRKISKEQVKKLAR
jgi:hypothetical protein